MKAFTFGETTFFGGYTAQIARSGPGAMSHSYSGRTEIFRVANDPRRTMI
jgi:hypothetical protein